MEVYERETKKVIRRFLARHLSFAKCISGLDAALARAIPHLLPIQLDELRDVMLANNNLVMEEMARRSQKGQNAQRRVVDLDSFR